MFSNHFEDIHRGLKAGVNWLAGVEIAILALMLFAVGIAL
jgi:hypothetical protein